MSENRSAKDKIADLLKAFWRKKGGASVITAKHTEFVVEPKIFIGDKLNPEILKLMVINYLIHASRQDSGWGNLDVAPDKLVIKNSKGKPLVVVRDQQLISQFLAARA